MNKTLIAGGVFGLTAVAAGAYANHGVEPQHFSKVLSAVRLQQVHSLAILALGLALYANLPAGLASKLKIAAGIFGLGILLFSGGIYLHYFLGVGDLSFLVPIGGMVVMAGWVVVVWAAIKSKASA